VKIAQYYQIGLNTLEGAPRSNNVHIIGSMIQSHSFTDFVTLHLLNGSFNLTK